MQAEQSRDVQLAGPSESQAADFRFRNVRPSGFAVLPRPPSSRGLQADAKQREPEAQKQASTFPVSTMAHCACRFSQVQKCQR